jgi:hypothetical protein
MPKEYRQVIDIDHALPANSGTNRTDEIACPKTNGKVLVRVYAYESIAVASGHPVTISMVTAANAAITDCCVTGATRSNVTYAAGDLMFEAVVPPTIEALGSFKVQFVAATSGVSAKEVTVQLSMIA